MELILAQWIEGGKAGGRCKLRIPDVWHGRPNAIASTTRCELMLVSSGQWGDGRDLLIGALATYAEGVRWICLGLMLSGLGLMFQALCVVSSDIEFAVYSLFARATAGLPQEDQRVLNELMTIWRDSDPNATVFLTGFFIVVLAVLGMLPDHRSKRRQKALRPRKMNVMWEIFGFELLAGIFVTLSDLWKWKLSYDLVKGINLPESETKERLAQGLIELLTQFWGRGLLLINGGITVGLAIWGLARYRYLYQQFLRTGDWSIGTHLGDR